MVFVSMIYPDSGLSKLFTGTPKSNSAVSVTLRNENVQTNISAKFKPFSIVLQFVNQGTRWVPIVKESLEKMRYQYRGAIPLHKYFGHLLSSAHRRTARQGTKAASDQPR